MREARSAVARDTLSQVAVDLDVDRVGAARRTAPARRAARVHARRCSRRTSLHASGRRDVTTTGGPASAATSRTAAATSSGSQIRGDRRVTRSRRPGAVAGGAHARPTPPQSTPSPHRGSTTRRSVPTPKGTGRFVDPDEALMKTETPSPKSRAVDTTEKRYPSTRPSNSRRRCPARKCRRPG